MTRRKISRLRQIAFLTNIKNARVLTVTVKIDQSEGMYQNLVYLNKLFKEIFTGVHSPPLPNLHAYYSLSTLRTSFRVALPLSERPEQAMDWVGQLPLPDLIVRSSLPRDGVLYLRWLDQGAVRFRPVVFVGRLFSMLLGLVSRAGRS